MNRKLKLIKIWTTVLFLVEAIGLAVLAILYIFNISDLHTKMSQDFFAYITIGFFVIDVIYIWIFIHILHTQNKRNTLTTIDIVGSDVKESYNFGDLGLAVLDEDNIVIWASDFFYNHHIELIGKDIYSVFPKLNTLINNSETNCAKLENHAEVYDVKYLSASRTFIFKNITEFEELNKMAKDEAICIGVIMIDNYSDIVGTSEDVNDLITRVRTYIYDYAKEHDVLLRLFRNDAYFCVCNYKSLEGMKADRFSLLDKVRNIGMHDAIQPTLSIGFSHDFPDVNKLNSMASSAIDIAMSRGGDQAVISRYGTELEYFGGRTSGVENRNKVKVRSVADTLINLINHSSNVIIMGHTNMDMDALGSALGVKSICDSFNKTSHVVFDLKKGERKVNSVVNSIKEIQKFFISPKEAIDKIRPQTLLIVVDVSRPKMTLEPTLLELSEKVVVIDHHRRAEDFVENPVLSYIDPSASSASELVAELIKYSTNSQQIKVESIVATIMLSGIFLDTNFFKARNVGIRTFEASSILEDMGADNVRADEWLKDDLEEFQLTSKIISTLQTPYTGVSYCTYTDDLVDQTILAKAANQCLQLSGIRAVFVIGKIDVNTVKISARSDGTVNVQVLCEKMGNGGGHFQMAACVFNNKSIAEVENILKDTLESNLSDALVERR